MNTNVFQCPYLQWRSAGLGSLDWCSVLANKNSWAIHGAMRGTSVNPCTAMVLTFFLSGDLQGGTRGEREYALTPK